MSTLTFRETLGENLGKIFIKSDKNMYDLATSFQKFPKKS